MNDLLWLSEWFASRCDGEWESDFGISLETVNNPGWMLRIDLDGTGLNPDAFKPVAHQRTATDWIEAKIHNGTFLGGCALANLPELLALFRAFVEGPSQKRPTTRPAAPSSPNSRPPPRRPR